LRYAIIKPMSHSTPSPDPRLAQALDAAERRLAMLERLAEMGMEVATAIRETVVEFPHRPGAGPQGARAYAQVSRAVRLTLMLAARVEKSILAMRKGELGLEAMLTARDAADPPATRAERVRAAVTPAIEREAGDAEDAEMLRRRLNARLCESDDSGAFLSRPFHDCVKAICVDLGLDPGPILAMEGATPVQSIPPPPAHPGECRGPDHRVRLAETLDST
jgi:hypothetical protein